MPGIIAIVGRPNVGKSALFNRIAGRRIAIVHDQPGVTRDRVSAEAEFKGRAFSLIDTGGIGLRRGEKSTDIITVAALEQVDLAIEAAQAIIFVVNVQEGLVPLDQEVAARLRLAGKPVLLAVNKSDNDRVAATAVDFSSLGFDDVFPVSAIHGRGIEDLTQAALEFLPVEYATPDGSPPVDEEDSDPDDPAAAEKAEARRETHPPRDFEKDPFRLAIVGRPNVGKSSLINALTQSNRVVVSPIPGTTRDAIDVPFEVDTEGHREKYVLVDTAGVRKRHSIDNSIEFYSVRRTEEAITRSDITVLVLDANDGILEQDKKIGALITDARRACIVVVNKWDLYQEKVLAARQEEIVRRNTGTRERDAERELTTLGEFAEWVQEKLFFLDYAPVIFTSAQSGFHLDRLLEAVRYVAAQLRQEVPTSLLNRTLQDAVVRRQPVSTQGHMLKFYYATQIGQFPPRFLLFFNRRDILTRNYEKHLINSIRTAFGFEGCPVVIIPRERPKTIAPFRKFDPERGKTGGKGFGRDKGPRKGADRGSISERGAGKRPFAKRHRPGTKPGAKPGVVAGGKPALKPSFGSPAKPGSPSAFKPGAKSGFKPDFKPGAKPGARGKSHAGPRRSSSRRGPGRGKS